MIAGKDRGDFFQEGCSFHIKNKLKFEIFNDKFIKKVYKFINKNVFVSHN